MSDDPWPPMLSIGAGDFPEVEISWPNPRPEWFRISADAFDAMIKEINAHRAVCRAKDLASESLAPELP